MDSRLLLSLPLAPMDTAPLQGFHAARRACRAAVRQHPSLGAALLFSGDGLQVLLEGPPDDLLACADHIVSVTGPLPFESWSEPIAPADGRQLRAGACHVGYVEIDPPAETALAVSSDVAGRMQAFMRLLAASDHD